MTDNESTAAIIIEGRRDDWPGGARTLIPCKPDREQDRQVHWFGAELDPDGIEVWFRISTEAVGRMKEKTPRARGNRLIDALLDWMKLPNRQSDLPDFDVEVDADGRTQVNQRDE